MSDLEQLSKRSASAIGRALMAGETTSVALAEYYLAKATSPEAEHVYICLTTERAMAEARAADARIADGRPLSALDGVPIVWKDLVDLKDTITTAASESLRTAPPATEDAPCAAHVTAQGMVALGKTNLTEFAYSGIGINPHYGTPKNPHSPGVGRIPGGSSSGTAVAVAANLAPCGIGTDTGGSVRNPAAFNGVVGYKTSEGRIDKSAVYALSGTLDSVGPLARSVEDCVLLDMALRGAVTSSVRRADLSGLEVLVPETIVLDDLDDAVADNFEASLKRLEAAGASIARARMPTFQGVMDVIADYGTLVSVEAYTLHKDLVDGPDAGIVDPRVKARIMAGKSMSAHALWQIIQRRTQLIEECRTFVGSRLIAMPTVPMTAPEIAPLETDDALFGKTNLKSLRNTNLGNVLRLCGLAIPNGKDSDGMPTSFSLCGLGDDDDRLLSYGLSAELVVRSA